jgi:hypothetical protein
MFKRMTSRAACAGTPSNELADSHGEKADEATSPRAGTGPARSMASSSREEAASAALSQVAGPIQGGRLPQPDIAPSPLSSGADESRCPTTPMKMLQPVVTEIVSTPPVTSPVTPGRAVDAAAGQQPRRRFARQCCYLLHRFRLLR